MGPNAIWQAEALSDRMHLQPGMRVLDMGCGAASSSIFLAKEFGVEVWATDLWVTPADNLRRVTEHGLQDRVRPIHAEAHALPFAEEFFDALVSFDAYHYFGTDDLYLGYYSRYVTPGGQIGIIVPGLAEEPPTLPRHTSSVTGSGTSAHSTARTGGVAIGRRRAWSPSRLLTVFPRAGGTGWHGTRPATVSAARPAKRPR